MYGGDNVQCIMKTEEGILIYQHGEKKILKKGLKQYLNELLLKEYSTYEGRIHAIKKRHKMYRNVPIFINHEYCFYTIHSLRHHQAVCINYHAVLSIRATDQNTTEIIFKNLQIIHLTVPYAYVLRKHMRTGWFIEQYTKEH